MKKSLLVSCAVSIAAMSAAAFEAPQTYPDASWQGISPDGHLLVSNLYGNLNILDLNSGKDWSYTDDGATNSYYVGIGNIVSNDGIILCSNKSDFNASYWKDGEWYEVAVPDINLTNSLMGITPDGSRICGIVGGAAVSINAETIMQLPAYWDRNADGTYGNYNMLPYPEKDFIGRTPQYVTATCISDDGKTIVGQVVDYSGMFCAPVVYTQDADGKWSYRYILEDIYTIKGEIPEFPGEGPAAPQPEDFMTAEEKAAFDAAMEQWAAEGYDYTKYPDPLTYLSAEGKAAYDAANAEYQTKYDEWSAAYEKWDEFFYGLFETVPQFTFNDLRLSPDGTIVTSSASEEDPENLNPWGMPATIEIPWIINVADGKYSKLEYGFSMAVTQIIDNDTFLAFNGVGVTPSTGYVVKNGECTNLYDYLAAQSTELKGWMDENLVHEVENFDWETGETTYDKYTFTGMTLASRDLSTIVFWTTSDWNFEYNTWGYIVRGLQAGVSQIEANKSTVAFDAAGNLNVSDDITSVRVYDLSGRLVLEDSSRANTLSNGIYIVRAQRNNGSAFSTKLAK